MKGFSLYYIGVYQRMPATVSVNRESTSCALLVSPPCSNNIKYLKAGFYLKIIVRIQVKYLYKHCICCINLNYYSVILKNYKRYNFKASVQPKIFTQMHYYLGYINYWKRLEIFEKMLIEQNRLTNYIEAGF